MNKLTPKSLIKDTLLFIFIAIPLGLFTWIIMALFTAVTSIAAMFGFDDRPPPGRKKPRSNS